MKGALPIILAVVGAVLGVIIVRMFFLNQLQIMGWNMFWHNLFRLNLDMFNLVFKSKTFLKCLIGFILGGGLGYFAGLVVNKKIKF